MNPEPKKTAEDYDVPTAETLLGLLQEYFHPPITRTHADWLHSVLLELHRNKARFFAETDAYQGIRKYMSTAWQCRLSRGVRYPGMKDLAMFFACRLPGFPQPKLHCPAEFCGHWREIEGPALGSEWRLGSTGYARVVGAEPRIEDPIKWHVDYDWSGNDLGYTWGALSTATEHGEWNGQVVKSIDDHTLTVLAPVHRRPSRERRLELVSRDPGLPEIWQTVPR
jgi:hypothetical protein